MTESGRESQRVDPVVVVSVLDFLRRNPYGYDLREMADHFAISEAVLREVIDFLWTLEFPDTVLSGSENMFDFDAAGLESDEPWVKLTHDPTAKVVRRFEPQELATVLVGLAALREYRSPEETEIIDRLSAKLRVAEPEAATREYPLARAHPVIGAMRRAIDRGRQLRITYFAENAEAPESRVVDPLAIEIRGDLVYLSAYCTRRKGMRWFRHDRVLDFQELDTRIAEYRDVDRQQPLAVRGRQYPRLQVAIKPAAFAALRPYLERKDFPELDADGYSRCTLTFRSFTVAARLAAENAGAFVVEAPADARKFTAEWARTALGFSASETQPKA